MTDTVSPCSSTFDDTPHRDGRHENSLAVLCQRFCEIYKDAQDPINIDIAAKELGIQRRRMYEILNIIQSVGLVTRIRASFYRWEGYNHMTATLEKLKEEGMRKYGKKTGVKNTLSSKNDIKSSIESPIKMNKKKAVATSLGERFIQIFLCNEFPQPIILEDIMGVFSTCIGIASNQMSCARRLYDIANIFCSIGLVKKTSSSARDNRRKKRLYTWVGPDLDEKIRRKSPVSVDTPPIVVTRTAGAKREATSDSSDEASSSYYAANLKRMKIIMAQDLSSEIIVPYKDSPQPNVVSPSLSEPESAESIDKDHSNKLCWTPACNSTQISGSCGGTPLSSVPGSALSVHNSSIASSHGGSLSQYSDFTDVESPILLQAQVNQLTKALQDAKNREKELLKRIEMQDSQINKLIDIKRHTPTFVLNSNSPIANFLFSPFGPSSANGSRSFLRKARIGPQIVDPAGEDDILLSPVQIVKDKEKNHGSSKSIISTPCNLIATAASSLLSLTPTQIPSFSSSYSILSSSPALDHDTSQNVYLESPASLASTFAGLSPLPSSGRISDCFS